MSNDFLPSATQEILRLRAEMLGRLRVFFDEREFLEVETPALSIDTVIDRHLDPLVTVIGDDPRRPEHGQQYFLQTSPEFHMKRLLAAGSGPIYQVTRAYRNAERGRLHNPEFTIAEWYRPGDDMAAGMELLSDLADAMLERGPAERLSYADAFERHAGIDPHRADVKKLVACARAREVAIPAGLSNSDRDAWLDLLLVELVEPHLGQQQPTILFDYPASQAALAKVRGEDPPVAERFELYVQGIELANGYHELLDADELRRRNSATNLHRLDDGKPDLPEESRLLAAMQHGLPACTGVALGFDRLVMLAAGANRVADVMAFPIDRA